MFLLCIIRAQDFQIELLEPCEEFEQNIAKFNGNIAYRGKNGFSLNGTLTVTRDFLRDVDVSFLNHISILYQNS